MPRSRFRPAVLVLASLLAATAAYAELPPHLVPWRQLSWADFQGTTAPLGPEVAMISSGVHIEPFDIDVEHLGGNSWIARAKDPQVYSYMDPALSGVRPGGNSDYALAHEQVHFDISELFARKIRTELREVEVEGDDPVRVRFDLEGRLWELRGGMLAELTETQKRYDHDCGHGKQKRRQKSWNKKIASQLSKTSP